MKVTDGLPPSRLTNERFSDTCPGRPDLHFRQAATAGKTC
jgi:hypothetical protein